MNRYMQQFFFSFFRSISNHTHKKVFILNKIFIFGNHCVKYGHKQMKPRLKQQLLLVEQTNYYTGGLNIYIFPPLSIIFFVSCRCNLFCKTFHSKLRKTRHIEVSLNAFFMVFFVFVCLSRTLILTSIRVQQLEKPGFPFTQVSKPYFCPKRLCQRHEQEEKILESGATPIHTSENHGLIFFSKYLLIDFISPQNCILLYHFFFILKSKVIDTCCSVQVPS